MIARNAGDAIVLAGYASRPQLPSVLLVTNSTISGNAGSGVRSSGSADAADLRYSRVSANGGGGLWGGFADGLDLTGTVLADPAAGANCAVTAVTSHGHDLDSNGSCGLTQPTNLPNSAPLLAPLQNNGGPTETHALLPGSPAIDAIPPADCTGDDDGDPGTPEAPLATDQRGLARPQDAGWDIGAAERGPCIGGRDTDGDGLADVCDDCPYSVNPGQEDTGGIGAGSAPDGIGDACHCGDVNGDGRITLADAVLLRRLLLQPPREALTKPELCDVGGSTGCSLSDALVIQRSLLNPPTAMVRQRGAAAG